MHFHSKVIPKLKCHHFIQTLISRVRPSSSSSQNWQGSSSNCGLRTITHCTICLCIIVTNKNYINAHLFTRSIIFTQLYVNHTRRHITMCRHDITLIVTSQYTSLWCNRRTCVIARESRQKMSLPGWTRKIPEGYPDTGR